MNDELDKLLEDETEQEDIDWSSVGEIKPKPNKKDPAVLQDELDDDEYLDDIQAVVYKIDDGTNCYVGRTCSLKNRLNSHVSQIDSKAHPIIHGYKGRRADLVEILWKGSWTDSQAAEAAYIEKYSTMQEPKEAVISARPLPETKYKRDNEIPISWQ
ncbi:GIY-YIG nuclease family protein [Vibrio campbellii]|uniref:GIY-YIG nuclease family protein n=1 Tax=Vibrio campbellii TaxID=680 RepID=UPI003F84E65E